MKTFVLYDERAHSIDPDECSVIDTAETEEEARRISRENARDGYIINALWVEYDLDGQMLTNPRRREDLGARKRGR